jgi:DNA-binding LytR/AlgR family response regulator
MKYIIIEDETIAAQRLKNLITQIRPDFKHVITLDSVESAVISLTALKADLFFIDVQLADGISFEIFDQVKIEGPIIFTTAYDNYAIQAFKQNSVDYLLKPIDPSELEGAIEKFEKLAVKSSEAAEEEEATYTQLIKSLQPSGKERFIVKVGDHLKNILCADIQAFYSKDKMSYLLTKEGKKYPVDYSLDRIDELVSPVDFFRISRKYIINLAHVGDIVSYTNSRLEIGLKYFDEEQVIVARERVADFKTWMDR